MNLESRVARLENLLFVNSEPPPLIFIKIASSEKGSQDEGTLGFAVIPGPSCGKNGAFLFRDEGESSNAFLERCSTQYAEVYDD